MDEKSNNHVLNVSYNTNGVVEEDVTITKNGNILRATYDDAINKQVAENCSKHLESFMSNSDIYAVSNKNKLKYFKKHFLMCLVLIIALLAGVVFCYIPNKSPGISSSKKYPMMNPDLCDPVNPYYDSSWFMPCPTINFLCDVPIKINKINVEGLRISNRVNCLSKLDCMANIGLYFLEFSKNSKYNFFVDCYGNVYEGRGWMCPYESGQLWVAVIVDSYNPNGDSKEMNRILKHINGEIVSYAVKCGFLNYSTVNYNYLSFIYNVE